ncbi:MAG: hypothetical protein K9W43_03180 [Candidatus Thorarchaeota archaeon]|nr:hypothetical protein [Candidatus Thorarchaeota archaeon]
MTVESIDRQDLLRSTLFHIQVSKCQYIDDFPDEVTDVLERYLIKRGVEDFNRIRRSLYRIDTNFFKINKIEKKKFYDGLFKRIRNLLDRQR